ncbi:TPA: GDSL-type esterase/lipase family protein [Klebsiella pneumoniae]
MTTISETADWIDAIYQITRMDKVEGGAKGVANIQAKQLAARTQFLKMMIEGFTDYNESTFFKTAEDPDGTIAGIAATPSGKLFRVAQGAVSDNAFVFYLNAAGVAKPVAAYAGKGYVDSRLVPGSYRPSFMPVLHDKDGSVPLWLDNGLLDAAGLGPVLQECVADIPNAWAQKFISQRELSASFFPLMHDKDGSVPLWLDKGLLDAAGLGPVLQGAIKNLVGNEPQKSYADKYFIRGDMFKFLFKRGRVFNGESVSLNVAFTGDSWTQINVIPASLIKVLGNNFKDPGFMSCAYGSRDSLAGITLQNGGFTVYDGDNENSATPPPYGSGPDGNALYTTTSAWFQWSGVTATDVTIYYYDGSGTFDVLVDGVISKTVQGGNTGAVLKCVLNGLTATPHIVKIQSAGSGVVSILGAYGKNSAKQSGVTVSRMGNGGAIASDYLNWDEYIHPIASDMDIDLLFIILGTNDFRKSKGIEQYKRGIQVIIDRYKSATPGVCICLISAAQSNTTGVPALSSYDAAMRELAIANNVNFISGYELFPKKYDYGTGAWADNLHLNPKGAYILTRTIKDAFFQE